MNTPWLDPMVTLPDDGQIVWVRREYWFSDPVLCRYSYDARTFQTIAHEMDMPWYMVSAWRAQGV